MPSNHVIEANAQHCCRKAKEAADGIAVAVHAALIHVIVVANAIVHCWMWCHWSPLHQ